MAMRASTQPDSMTAVDHERGQALVYRPDGSITIVDRGGALDGEAVLPGFSCALADVLE